jgi:Bacterial membrane protein YfhO
VPTSDTELPHARSHWPDVLGVLWIIAAACVALVPALLHGSYLGSYDILTHYGLTTHPQGFIHNAAAGDQSYEVIPWITLAWDQVHQGHLPLWNGYEALGMPLAFNFGSGAFSLPALVSYLTPLRDVYLVQIIVSFVVGGTGAYFFGRVLRLHPVACAFAGTTWVLSGPFIGYLGLPDVAVMSWAGWQFAAVVLIVRGTHRLGAIALFAVSLAFSILAGNPQIEILILLPLAVFAAVLLLFRTAALRGSGPIRRPILDMAIAAIVGGALAAPLLLPGLQLVDASIRHSAKAVTANPIDQVLATIFQSFWGQPLAGSFVNSQGFYPETWVWVGAIALVLAVVAVGIRWRRPEVAGLAAAGVVAIAACCNQPVLDLLSKIPLIGSTLWNRSLIPLAFCLAMLAGIGVDAVLRSAERRQAVRWALGAFGAIAILLGLIWLFGRGHLPDYAANVRTKSFLFPAVSTALGLGAFGILAVIERKSVGKKWSLSGSRRLALGIAALLLVCQTVLLIVVDAPVPSSASTPDPSTPGTLALQRAVGSSLVGLGVNPKDYGGDRVGFAPDSNILYGVNQFAEYDPIAPLAWFNTWGPTNGTYPGIPLVYYFAPGINSATVARRYGVSYVLELHGVAGPSGGVFDRRVGNEDLYRIPGAATATLVPASPSGGWPAIDAGGSPVPVTRPSPSKVRLRTSSSTAQVLRLRVASLPGWHATIDGRPLTLSPYLSMMFQAHIPPGRHVIELSYWPKRFTEGIVLAALAVIGLVIAALVAWRRSIAVRVRGEGLD